MLTSAYASSRLPMSAFSIGNTDALWYKKLSGQVLIVDNLCFSFNENISYCYLLKTEIPEPKLCYYWLKMMSSSRA